MNSTEFVNAIKLTVGKSTVTEINETLGKPSGRSPDPKLLKLSRWYNELSSQDRENMNEVIKLTIDNCLFGVLCVLDGVRVIERGPEKGELALNYLKDGQVTRLNDQSAMYLHDIYNADT